MPGVVTLATDEGPPVNRTAPTISGTPTQGQTLTANPGTWDGTPPLTYGYQWRRCNAAGASCVDIGGATGTTYVLTATDVGSTIRVVVTLTNAAGSGNATSAQTATIAGLPPVNTVLPTISGTTTDGQTLTAANGTWTGTTPITTRTSGVAATRPAPAARTSPARRRARTRSSAPTSVRRSASS